MASARAMACKACAAAFWLAALAAQAEPDQARLGLARGYPVGSTSNWYVDPWRVGSWSALDQVGLPVRGVARGPVVAPLPVAAQPAAISYRFGNTSYTLDDYLERRRVTGLLVIKDGRIVAERYRYGRTEAARFLSFSMAK